MRRLAAVGTALALPLLAVPATAQAAAPPAAGEVSAAAKLTHSQATTMFRNAGITWSSSGNCSDRNRPTCTSFEQIREDTVKGAITLKRASGCALNVTGGTETGHASGTYSHWNGYKLDYSLSTCVQNYVNANFSYIGGNKWRSGSGNVYYRESNHWDVTYYNCGGC
ncbi:hypothetical protein H3146_03645 [Streptomyces sp. OF3]|uniref:Peptidase M15 n=1 Tax=Streptomyces alkaliterrae TaxID=2213162 RepID=A0A5P0YJP1_9ACTN|nr:hypothetical protein [Streptomyces alkaliterrae]MBB1258655.1 hypothetical protein [Streptomyces alkaliterrae]MQS00594.1 hypothetical protein [Streptomyces alkaliterrae]